MVNLNLIFSRIFSRIRYFLLPILKYYKKVRLVKNIDVEDEHVSNRRIKKLITMSIRFCILLIGILGNNYIK
jgi:hypothetical protein